MTNVWYLVRLCVHMCVVCLSVPVPVCMSVSMCVWYESYFLINVCHWGLSKLPAPVDYWCYPEDNRSLPLSFVLPSSLALCSSLALSSFSRSFLFLSLFPLSLAIPSFSRYPLFLSLFPLSLAIPHFLTPLWHRVTRSSVMTSLPGGYVPYFATDPKLQLSDIMENT